MNSRQDQLAIFNAQTQNVRELERAWKATQRTINARLARGDFGNALLHTKIQALILCALSEAWFSKLIHTPYGFQLQEIVQIKEAARTNIKDAWIKCLELGLRKIESSPKSSYVPNTRQAVEKLIEKYVAESALLRNKVAHGQWVRALNREHTAINKDVSQQLADLDTVQLGRVKEGLNGLCAIVESLIESPDRTFHRDYWVIVAETNAKLDDMETWTLQAKVKFLQLKTSYVSRRH
jgi:hypothetical protein